MKIVTKKDVVLPKRKAAARKGDSGRVLVIGGSEAYVGAVALAGLAALRSGCDWVTVIAPEKVAWAVNCLSPDLVTKKLKGNAFEKKHVGAVVSESKKHSCVLIGNGMGTSDKTIRCIKEMNEGIMLPKVIDADGVKALSLQELRSTIVTPHEKELEILLLNSWVSMRKIEQIKKEKNIEKKAKSIQKATAAVGMLSENNKSFFENGNVIVLKGKTDAIITRNNIYYNKTGNPGLAKAGTGDVLAGLISGFLAQSNDLVQSAINGAYFNGLIGDILLKKKKGFTYLASDMVEEIKRIILSQRGNLTKPRIHLAKS